MGLFEDVWRGSVAISLLGGGLVLVHVGHVATASESLWSLVVGSVLPMVVSVGVLVGGVWLSRSRATRTETRRVWLWCLVGVAVLGLAAALIVAYQYAHGIRLADQRLLVLDTGSFGALVGFVVGVYDAQRRRQRERSHRRERALHDLHATTRELVRTSDREAIAAKAVEAARDILDLPVSGCWLYDESADALRPVAITDEGEQIIDDVPTYTAGDSLSWEAFETGELMRFDDVSSDPGRYRADTPIRSEIILPLGEYGVMNIGSTAPGAFDDVDVSLARLLAANALAAFRRTDRERQLADARDRSERLNRRLTVLNRVFRHDLRNATNVIEGHADWLVDRVEGDRARRSAATIREQAAGLVSTSEQVRDVEALFRTDSSERRVVDLVDVVAAQLDRVEAAYPAAETVAPERDAARAYAHPLVESAVANVVENAVEHNDRETPRVEAEIVRDGDRVTLRIADDGPAIPETEVAVLERGYETPLEHASGLGLWLANWIVRESGGEVTFAERDPRGSVVRLRFDRADADEPAGRES